jgi:hypothetical protein
MKKIFMLLALAVSFVFNADAQSNNVKVVNNSKCDVHFQLLGGRRGTCTISSVGPSSGPVTLVGSGTSIFYPNPTTVPMPGLAATDWFLGAFLYDRDAACGTPNVYRIGEPCTGLAPSQTYVSINSACDRECVVKATWTTGALIFN